MRFMLQHSGQERSPKILLSEPSESKLILESDEVEDIVSKNRNLSTVESERRTCATLVQSVRSDLTPKLNRLSPDSLCQSKLGFDVD